MCWTCESKYVVVASTLMYINIMPVPSVMEKLFFHYFQSIPLTLEYVL